MKMTISEYGVSLISEFEGAPRLRARECLGGRFEVSYGVTFDVDGSEIKPGREITFAEHLQIFKNALGAFEDVVNKSVAVELNQFQFDALVALAYNIGPDAFKTSSVLRNTNARRWEDAAAAFGMWVYATKNTDNRGRPIMDPSGTNQVSYTRALRGLLRREYATACLYLGHDWKEACEDSDIEMTVSKEWEGDRNRYKDAVTYKTPWKDVVAVAREYPLDPPVHLGADNPLAVEAPARKVSRKAKKVADPLPNVPAATEPVKVKSKSPVKSTTIWGGFLLLLASDPTVQSIALTFANAEGEGLAVRVLQAVGLFLVVSGRMSANRPLNMGRSI